MRGRSGRNVRREIRGGGGGEVGFPGGPFIKGKVREELINSLR